MNHSDFLMVTNTSHHKNGLYSSVSPIIKKKNWPGAYTPGLQYIVWALYEPCPRSSCRDCTIKGTNRFATPLESCAPKLLLLQKSHSLCLPLCFLLTYFRITLYCMDIYCNHFINIIFLFITGKLFLVTITADFCYLWNCTLILSHWKNKGPSPEFPTLGVVRVIFYF